jgi:TRAP-type mannitol/chloroaromatic compound transport system permease small subunit
MRVLLGLSRAIDALNETIGKLSYWLILAAVLISTGNAVVRY